MKRFLSSVISLSLFASTVSIPVFAQGSTTITPQMTWVDYNNADTAMGYIAAGSTARTGYNKISNGTIGWGNTGWNENKIAYLKVDASGITDSNIVGAVLSIDVSGSSDNKRTCGYGVLAVPYTDWDDTLTYNGAVSNSMTSGTAIGDVAWTSTKSSTTFETKTIDITDALNSDEDRVVTLAIYETAPAGGYIKNPSVTVEHSNSSVYTVTYDVDGTVTEEKVVEGEYVAEVPATVKTGYLFKGWIKNDTSSAIFPTEAVTGTAVESDLKWTAVFEKDPDYIEPITSMTVTGPSKMTLGPDPDTAVANTYSITLTGELGTDIVANPDSRVTDYNVEWEFLGYKTENDTEGQYCDSYGSVSYNGTPATSADFNLKNVSFNFYGKIKATVTYNGQTIEAATYALILGDESSDPNVILPSAGYPSDVSTYSDELVGYTCVDETYGNSTDAILGNFCVAGSDSVKSLTLMEEDGAKFLRMSKGTAKKSGVATHKISSPATQIIAEQDVRFNSTGGVITMTAGYPFWSSNSSYGEAITLSFTGSGLTLNGVALTNGDNAATISSGTWYKVIISVDKTTETAYAQVYDKTGETLIGEVYDVAWSASCTPNFYSFGMGNSVTGTIDYNNYKMYYPTVDTESFEIATESETLSIPAAESTTLVASVKSTDGYKISAAAEWKITDESMAEGVTITPDATDSHKAVVSVSSSAVPGTLPVQVTIGGYSKTIELTLTSSADSIKFTKSSSSVSIPLEAGATESVQFEAMVIDKDAQKVNDCTYAVYDKNNSAELTTLPSGITFDAATGTLTVAAGALPATLTIRATGNNSSGESISKAVKVTIHGLSFDLGAGTDADIAEGYTSVSPDTTYTEKLGFGIEGSATAGGTGSITDANGDYLEGSFKFNAKVAAGNVYKVTVNFSGNMVSEYVSDVLSGHTRTLDASSTTYTGYTVATTEIAEHVYNIPVVDDVLDLSFTNAKVASISVEKVDRVASEKPHIYSVGDSTLGNNGSYGYVLARDQANYPELTALATYHNNGKGSRNLSTYYTQGWLDNVLASVNPGDIVTIGNMGTNAGGLSGSAFKAPLDYYVDAALAMGAKVILTSYTPHGAVSSWAGGYDSATQTFTSYRTDSYDSEGIRVIYEERKNDEGILGFIDIGKNADAAFNAYVDDYAANGYESRDAAAQAIIACFPDHNHYNGLACQLMLEGYGDATGIVPELVRLLSAEDDTDEPTPTPTVEPIATPEPGERGIYLELDEINSTETIKIIKAKYKGFTTIKSASFKLPLEVEKISSIELYWNETFDSWIKSENVKDGWFTDAELEAIHVATASHGDEVMSPSGEIITIKIELKECLLEDMVLQPQDMLLYGDGEENVDMETLVAGSLTLIAGPTPLPGTQKPIETPTPTPTVPPVEETPSPTPSVEVYFDGGIEIEPPTKTTYTEGEYLDTTGLTVYSISGIRYSDGTVQITTKEECGIISVEPSDRALTVDDTEISITFWDAFMHGERTETTPITVLPATEETPIPSDRPDVVGDNLITNGNFADGTTDWTNAADGGAYTGTLTAEAPYVHGDGQALTNTVSAGGSAATTLRRFVPVEAGKQYYLSYYAYNTGEAITGTAFMSAFVPVTGMAFGSFNGVTFKDYVEYGGQNSWSAEPQSEVNRSRDDMDYDAGMNHKEFIFTIPEGADHILISMFAWTDPARIYISDFELYEVAQAEETPSPTPTVKVVEAKASVESGVVPYGTVVTISSSAHVAVKDDNGEWVYDYFTPTYTITEDTTITVKAWIDNIEEGVTYECPEVTYTYTVDPATIPTPPPAAGVYNVIFAVHSDYTLTVYTDETKATVAEAPYKTTDGKLYFDLELTATPAPGDGVLRVETSNGILENEKGSYTLTGVTEDTTVTATYYSGPIIDLDVTRGEDGTVTAELVAYYAGMSTPDGTRFVASYTDDGRLYSVQMSDAVDLRFTFEFKDLPDNVKTFKAMWWNTANAMEPVIESETVTIE